MAKQKKENHIAQFKKFDQYSGCNIERWLSANTYSKVVELAAAEKGK
jgi:hypothetical protein